MSGQFICNMEKRGNFVEKFGKFVTQSIPSVRHANPPTKRKKKNQWQKWYNLNQGKTEKDNVYKEQNFSRWFHFTFSGFWSNLGKGSPGSLTAVLFDRSRQVKVGFWFSGWWFKTV